VERFHHRQLPIIGECFTNQMPTVQQPLSRQAHTFMQRGTSYTAQQQSIQAQQCTMSPKSAQVPEKSQSILSKIK
jgi:hypothetical protein